MAYDHAVARSGRRGGPLRAQGYAALHRGAPAHARVDGQGQQQTLYDRDSGRHDESAGPPAGQSRLCGRRLVGRLRLAGRSRDTDRRPRPPMDARPHRAVTSSPPPRAAISSRRPRRSPQLRPCRRTIRTICPSDGSRDPGRGMRLRADEERRLRPLWDGGVFLLPFTFYFSLFPLSSAAPTAIAGSAARGGPAGRSGGR